MARGDITVTISANLADNGTVDHQPGSGVESRLMGSCGVEVWAGTLPNLTPDMNIYIIDGTNNLSLIRQGNAGAGALVWNRGKNLATNTNYFRFKNRVGASSDTSFAVIDIG